MKNNSDLVFTFAVAISSLAAQNIFNHEIERLKDDDVTIFHSKPLIFRKRYQRPPKNERKFASFGTVKTEMNSFFRRKGGGNGKHLL